jgi:predicted SprT family Zn-dependent metalloprotease
MKPTKQTYEALQRAFDFFNRHLFESALPACMITLQRRDKRSRGYFSQERFKEVYGELRTDEIALNPQRFLRASVEEVLSTLAHEMVHMWQFKFGAPSRSGYHNKQWAAKMKTVGLQPSHSGEPGGKETGQHMTHYIMKEGPFAQACVRLKASGFHLSWGDVFEPDDASVNSSRRVKYTCPTCEINAWGKPDLLLFCGACMGEAVKQARANGDEHLHMADFVMRTTSTAALPETDELRIAA